MLVLLFRQIFRATHMDDSTRYEIIQYRSTSLNFKQGWYLNFSAWSVKNLLFEQKKVTSGIF